MNGARVIYVNADIVIASSVLVIFARYSTELAPLVDWERGEGQKLLARATSLPPADAG